MQVLGLGFIKLSFLFFFRRVFVTNHSSITKLFGIVNMVMIILVALWTVAFLFAYIFICGTNPFAYYGRDQVYEKQRCVNTSALLDSFAASDLLGDIIILVMPIERVSISLMPVLGSSMTLKSRCGDFTCLFERR